MYSAQNGILRIMTTYNDPLMTEAMMVMEMLVGVCDGSSSFDSKSNDGNDDRRH